MADLRLTVALAATDRLSAPLRKLADASGRLGKEFTATLAALKKFQEQQALVGRARTLQQGLREADQKLAENRQRMQALSTAMAFSREAAKRLGPEYKAAADTVTRLSKALQRQRDEARDLGARMRELGLGKLTADEKRLSAAIEQTTQTMARQQARMEKLDAARQRRDKAVALGGEMAGFGYGAYHSGMRAAGGLLHIMEPAKEAQRYEARIHALKMDPKQTAEGLEYAKNLKVAGVSSVDNIKLLADGMSAFADVHHAEMALPAMSKFHAILGQLFPEGGGEEMEKRLVDGLKAIDLRGGTRNQEEFNRQANMMTQVLLASNGRVGPDEWNALIKRSGVYGMGISNDAFYYKLEPLIQMTSGNTVGTGLMSMYQSLFQGKTTKRAAQNLMKYGLIADPSKITHDKSGQISHINPGALAGSALFKADPVAWVNTVLVPHLQKRGAVTEQQILDAIGSITGNRTAANIMGMIYKNRDLIERDAARNRGVENIDQLHARQMGTAEGQEQDLIARRNTLYHKLGEKALPLYVKLLEVLSKVVDKVSDFVEQNPVLSKWLLVGAAGAAVLAVALGAVLIPLGLMIGQFALLRLAMAYLGGGGGLGRVLGAAGAAGGKAGLWSRAVAGFAAMRQGIGLLLTRLTSLRGVFGLLRGGLFGILKGVFFFARANPIAALVLGITGAVAGFIERWDKIKQYFNAGEWGKLAGEIWGALEQGLNWATLGLFGFFKDLAMKALSGVWEGMKAAVQWINGNSDNPTGAMNANNAWAARDRLNQKAKEAAAGAPAVPAVAVAGNAFAQRAQAAQAQRAAAALATPATSAAATNPDNPWTRRSQAAQKAAAAAALAASVGVAAPAIAAPQPLAAPVKAAAPVINQTNTHNITINPAPGMDEKAVGQAVSKELDKRDRAQRSRVNSQLSDME